MGLESFELYGRFLIGFDGVDSAYINVKRKDLGFCVADSMTSNRL